MLIRIIILTILISSYFNGVCQTTNIDSLKQVLNNTKDVQHQVEIYNTLAKIYLNINLDSAEYFNINALDVVKKTGNEKLILTTATNQVEVKTKMRKVVEANELADKLFPKLFATNDTSNLLLLFHLKFRAKYLQQAHDSTLYFLEQGLLLADNYPKAEGRFYGNMAFVYREKNNIPKAIELFFKSLEKCQEAGDISNVATLHLNIGMAYVDQSQQKKAVEYFKKGIKIAEGIDDLHRMTWAYTVLASCYRDLEQYDHSLKAYKKSLQLAENVKDIYMIFHNKCELAYHYLKYEPSNANFQLAVQLMNEVENMEMSVEEASNAYYYLSKAFISSRLGQKKAAIDYAEDAFRVTEAGKNTSTIILITGELAEFYPEIGDYKKAYEYHVIFKTLSDSLANDINLAAIEIQEAQHQFEIEKAEQDKELAKTQSALRLRTIVGIAGLLILSLVSALAFALRRTARLKNEQNQILEKEVTERTEALLSANRALEEAKTKQQLEEAKSRFFANVSHEFRTPLTLIQAPLENLLKTEPLSVKANTTIHKILKNSNRLMRLVTEILDLSKLDKNKLELVPSKETLLLLVRRVVSNYESYVQQKGINLSLEYLANPNLQLEIDKDKFEIILHNYISNAVKFTPKDGKIDIVVKDNGQKINVVVSDTGIGIPQNELENVFDRYYQVANKNTAYAAGSGIGLSICKEYAQLFGGKVWAESSTAAGQQGSTFYFEFPKKEIFTQIDDEQAQAIKEEQSKDTQVDTPIPVLPVEDKNTDKEKILVVEDNYDLRSFLHELLSEDYQVVTAEHGQEALDILEKNKCDLIISDVMMPIMDGFKLLENLKSSDDYKQIPTIMLTARAGLNDKLDALRIGVDDYILKPFNEDELKVRVNNLISFSERRSVAIDEIDHQEEPIENTKKLTPVDEAFLRNLEVEVKKSIGDFKLNANHLADEFHVSRSQLFRKVKLLTGLTVNEYIKEARLQFAKESLETKTVSSVKEVAYLVGFKHSNYFSISYEQRFGKRPSEYFI